MVSASPSSRASTASVVLLRVPLSFPAGLPLFPGSKGISGIASVLHFQLSARILARSPRQNEVLSNRTKFLSNRTKFFLTERKENIKRQVRKCNDTTPRARCPDSAALLSQTSSLRSVGGPLHMSQRPTIIARNP